jgi:hypothetical protein
MVFTEHSATRGRKSPMFTGSDELKQRVRAMVPQGEHLSFVNMTGFLAGSERFLLGYVRHPDWRTGGFLKIAVADTKPGEELRREAQVTALAGSLGIRSVEVLQPYTSEDGLGLVVFERLKQKTCRLFSSKSQLARVHPAIGRRVAVAFAGDVLKKIPADQDTSFLKRHDPRNENATSFFDLWHGCERRLFAKRLPVAYLPYRQQVPDLRKIMTQVRRSVIDEIESGDRDQVEKFVHNDYALTNLGLHRRRTKTGAGITVLDYEHGGASKNSVLALITDAADFYRSCGVNNELRMQFIFELLNIWKKSELEHGHDILAAAMTFGTLLHSGSAAKNRLHPDHHEHGEAMDLLTTLPNNLQRLQMRVDVA